MKKIISGKRYDTDTAEGVATWDNGRMTNDFNFCEEGLYKTARGNWFLWGAGGPLSPYARQTGNETTGSEDIRPFTADEARTWLEEKQCLDALEEHFPDEIEDA